MKKINQIIETLKTWYNSEDELAKDLINCIFLTATALIIAFAFGLAFYFLNI